MWKLALTLNEKWHLTVHLDNMLLLQRETKPEYKISVLKCMIITLQKQGKPLVLSSIVMRKFSAIFVTFLYLFFLLAWFLCKVFTMVSVWQSCGTLIIFGEQSYKLQKNYYLFKKYYSCKIKVGFLIWLASQISKWKKNVFR